MPVPKRKTSRQRRNKRHANKGIKMKAAISCLTCQAPISSHEVCKQCGYYKGVKVIRTKTDRMHDRGKALQAKRNRLQKNAPPKETPQEPQNDQ